ncbi:MAG: 23S rRNA (adenine(2503)-C(2))-methyltransferase RlmN [Verrucomicrobiota bacterium]
MAGKTDLRSLNRDELAQSLAELSQPAYRCNQILDWLWKKKAASLEEMSNLPTSLRQSLSEKHPLSSPELTRTQGSQDTTRKLLLKLQDGRFVECVLIPASPALYGDRSDRLTLCVSSQVGCAFGCKFCASGLLGFTRNLSPAEIVSQIILAENLAGARINNLVFMGMGEPLANINNLLRAIEIITSPWGLGIGARHLTVSTSGLVPQIKKLADFPRQIRLAISLHGATDEVRSKIMPVNERWPIDQLFESLRYWNSRRKQHLTLEYILIQNVNDHLDQARILGRRARSIHAKVNLIPYNTVDGLDWVRPSEDHCRKFQSILSEAGVSATLRLEKGHDIDAACGQLRLKEELSKPHQNGISSSSSS